MTVDITYKRTAIRTIVKSMVFESRHTNSDVYLLRHKDGMLLTAESPDECPERTLIFTAKRPDFNWHPLDDWDGIRTFIGPTDWGEQDEFIVNVPDGHDPEYGRVPSQTEIAYAQNSINKSSPEKFDVSSYRRAWFMTFADRVLEDMRTYDFKPAVDVIMSRCKAAARNTPKN